MCLSCKAEKGRGNKRSFFQENYIPPGKDLPAPGASASAAVGSAPQGIAGTWQSRHRCNLATDFGKERVFTAGFAISSQKYESHWGKAISMQESLVLNKIKLNFLDSAWLS